MCQLRIRRNFVSPSLPSDPRRNSPTTFQLAPLLQLHRRNTKHPPGPSAIVVADTSPSIRTASLRGTTSQILSLVLTRVPGRRSYGNVTCGEALRGDDS